MAHVFIEEKTVKEIIKRMYKRNKVAGMICELCWLRNFRVGDVRKAKVSDFRKEKLPEDREKIIAYCNKMGFVDAYIVSDSFVIDTAANRMTIHIEIYEGPQYYFGETSFMGNEVYNIELLSKALKFKTGEVFNEEKAE